MEAPFEKHFGDLPDPRNGNAQKHLLCDIIGLVVIAVICFAEGWEEIELFGKSKQEFLKKILRLPYGIPSHDTIERVMKQLNPVKFEECFLEWTKTLHQKSDGEIVAFDGKTLRGSKDTQAGKAAIHMVSAWSCESNLVLGQLKVDEKSNEITAIPRLLELLDLKGCTVSIDAMGCQRDIAEKIVSVEADYLLGLKGNQPTMLEETIALFDSIGTQSTHVWQEKDHGRIETRKCSVLYQVDMLDEPHQWPGLNALVKIESTRTIGEKSQAETRFYISSRKDDAEKFNSMVRTHWGIENSLHWVLDVQFQEDSRRKRKDNAPENLAIARRIALNLLKKDPTPRRSIKVKRLRAGWNEEYFLQILGYLDI